jgi:heme A synthase
MLMTTFLRVTSALQILAVFLSAVTAGLLLTTPNGHVLHSAAAYTVWIVAVVQVVAAVLVWRPGGGSPRGVGYAVVFLGLVTAQVFLGIAHVKAVHVPLGVVLFGVSLVQLSRRSACLPPRGRSRRPGRRASRVAA